MVLQKDDAVDDQESQRDLEETVRILLEDMSVEQFQLNPLNIPLAVTIEILCAIYTCDPSFQSLLETQKVLAESGTETVFKWLPDSVSVMLTF